MMVSELVIDSWSVAAVADVGPLATVLRVVASGEAKMNKLRRSGGRNLHVNNVHGNATGRAGGASPRHVCGSMCSSRQPTNKNGDCTKSLAHALITLVLP
jgi:hypothetical protein